MEPKPPKPKEALPVGLPWWLEPDNRFTRKFRNWGGDKLIARKCRVAKRNRANQLAAQARRRNRKAA